ncbi:MAG: hypothetical protein ACYCQI_15100 [Gammaproteobacteria bacterium]
MLERPEAKKPAILTGPIIQTSFDRDQVEIIGRCLAEQYNVDLIPIHEFDFKTANPKYLRFTFWGHGKQDLYAGKNPRQFALGLINKLHLLDRIPKVEVIDLVGCEIGLITDRNSFVRQVAAVLYEKGYTGRINAFTNLSSLQGNIVSSMQIAVRQILETFSRFTLQGIPERNKEKYAAAMKQLEPIKVEAHELEKKLIELEKNINELQKKINELQEAKAKIPAENKSFQRDVNKKNKEDIRDAEQRMHKLMIESSILEARYNKIVDKINSESPKVFDKYCIDFDSTRDIRAKLDRNKNFQLTPETFKELSILSDARIEAMVLINNLLSKYPKKIYAADNAWSAKKRKKAEVYRLEEACLEMLLKNIRDPSVNRRDLIECIDGFLKKKDELAALIPYLNKIRDYIENEKVQDLKQDTTSVMKELKISPGVIKASLTESASDSEKKKAAADTARVQLAGVQQREVEEKDKKKEEKESSPSVTKRDATVTDPSQRPG